MISRATRMSVARLVFLALYAVAFVVAGFGHWSQPVFVVDYILVSVLWMGLLAIFIVEVRRGGSLWGYLKHSPAVPLLLVSPVFLFLDWDAVWFVMIIAAYIFELRRHSAGDGFTFSFALIVFVGVLGAITMVELENDNPESQFQSPADAAYWAFGGVLRINTGRSYTPLTEDGRFLATTVAICGVIAASMFTARLVSWIVGERTATDVEPSGEASVEELRNRVIALQAEVDRLTAAAGAGENPPAGRDRTDPA